jgi:hypothetical protein
MTAPENISDAELRRMRDKVYPPTPRNIQTDEAWEIVKHKWRADLEWLRAEYNKEMKKL